jgi:hypothetical protein
MGKRLMTKKWWSSLILILAIGLLINVVNNNCGKWTMHRVLTYDVFGYYNYLPAVFIYHNITTYPHIDSIEQKYQPTGGAYQKYGLHPTPDGKALCNQYPLGVALFELPGFLITHTWNTTTKKFPPDGYSEPYQWSVVLSNLVAALLGLFFIALLLHHYFSATITNLVLVCIACGTNFFQYAGLDSGLSHMYLFFVYAVVLYLTHRWYLQPRAWLAALLGLFIGWAVITRPVDLFLICIPLCWPTSQRWLLWKKHYTHIALALLMAILLVFPQLLYWHWVTGKWIYYSYSPIDYFDFKHIRIMDGLFSFRKGWFIYTPLVALSFLGLLPLRSTTFGKGYAKLTLIYFIPVLFVVFAWHNWFYGWSFSCRALLQTIPILAIPLAAVLQYAYRSHVAFKVLMSLVLVLCLSLNLFQHWQYNHGVIHGTNMNRAAYRHVFLKTESDSVVQKIWYKQQQEDFEKGW